MKMSETQGTKRTVTRWTALVGALLTPTIISMFVGSRPAQGAISCDLGESVYMINPVVTIVEGAGNIEAEQKHWSALGESNLVAPLDIGVGERAFKLEPVP